MAFLVLSRPTSPLDLLIIVIVLAVLVGARELPKRLNASLRPLWIPVVVIVAVAGVFLLIAGAPQPLGLPPKHPATLPANVWTTLRLTGVRLQQCIGNFGWLSIPVPTWVVVVWTSCVAALTVASAALSRRCRRSLFVLALLIVALPVVLESPRINELSTWWQGRYWLPIVIGFPLVASTFDWPDRWRRDAERLRRRAVWLALALAMLLTAAQSTSFIATLRRYETAAEWVPPGGKVPVVVLFFAGAIVFVTLVVFTVARAPRDPGHLPEPESGSGREASNPEPQLA